MIEVYIDGASAGNPGPSGAGIYINYKNGKVEHHSTFLGELTNHEAEFEALIIALHLCCEQKIKTVSFRTDSKLVDDAIEKQHVKNPLYQPYVKEALELIDRHFDLFFLKWIPSRQNQQADQLARQAIIKGRK
ncbi:reverse transcriptase-like protein [Halalkalibacter sp. APA_J-10(15)]|uniref:reverse transcriptase-like protein n=1 Tax=Halalkalibacter sp. APA_J-10(15) TaxID=2933805 RepID=UPI001FF1F97F|nr:reverse transcriptase-like protein [Halalkalibacter sp. APA_J-10(15)]MCK0472022.1 reverse transcriptase-like protein [Halalkalibacter sp. APA_J-10(15)]